MPSDPLKTTLERAFELAGSGECRNVGDIRRTLRDEGYRQEQLVGATLLRQLRETIADANHRRPQ